MQRAHHHDEDGNDFSGSLTTARFIKYLNTSSLLIFVIWTVFIGALLFLLERSAAAATRSIKHPWYYDELPSILLTIFAQGHAAITVSYLGRLAVSALDLPRRSPASWQELFWQADHVWTGPVAMLSVLYTKLKTGVSLSSTFFLFTATCFIALVTPIFLTRAYPLTTVIVDIRQTLTLNVFSPPQIQIVDGTTQLATGGGAWSTGKSIINLFNSSVFLPAGVNRNDDHAVNDIFFVGDTLGSDLELPGIRTQGQCRVVNPGPTASISVLTNQLCPQLPLNRQNGTANVHNFLANVSMQYCCSTMVTPTSFIASAYIWINATNSTHTASGISLCNVTYSTGTAQLDGTNRTFKAFREVAYYNVTTAQGAEPIHNPLTAALSVLSRSVTKFDPSALLNMLGYVAFGEVLGNPAYDQPTLEDMSAGIWQGSAFMSGAVALLAQTNDSYPATFHRTTAGRVVNPALSIFTFILLGLWLLLVLISTVLLFRPTRLGGSMNASVTARLFLGHPDVLAGIPLPENLKEDKKLMRRRFERMTGRGLAHDSGFEL